jgi:hypothetical protein
MEVSVFASQAWGSTPFILQVSMSEAMTAQFSAPASCPANRAFFRFKAMGRMWKVEVNGFDYFDPKAGDLVSGGKKQIAMWSLDTDYD